MCLHHIFPHTLLRLAAWINPLTDCEAVHGGSINPCTIEHAWLLLRKGFSFQQHKRFSKSSIKNAPDHCVPSTCLSRCTGSPIDTLRPISQYLRFSHRLGGNVRSESNLRLEHNSTEKVNSDVRDRCEVRSLNNTL